MTCQITIIIPALNEAHTINQTLAHLFNHSDDGDYEVLVADGSPACTTLKAIRYEGVKKIVSAPGRGRQMNAGARCASGDILLFLHADTLLPRNGLRQVAGVCRSDAVAGGAFDLSVDSPHRAFRLIEKTASLRSRITRIPYGDQAIFLKREIFFRLGGYREIPLMEDVDLMRRVRASRRKIVLLTDTVRTSARRWEKEGICCGTLRNWALVTLYLTGVSPERLARFYR
ncbi:hypothetical protein DENIS_3741 [Desulfonema ishimotonii]|uniref:Glycosyltransferase 2-like domain-containing protein n=1 Tax=Desulfonema ishimotonii TaxID=45657 RepID=A0A401G0L6_9BACT|nr:TIGR04283 family arsenosugar biosynthesis glycosyltransferase [Desulfonema ishimotonii]GBC62764.1 hypothetical protein DENIS_3741 [Desulfonema ishimotonii]